MRVWDKVSYVLRTLIFRFICWPCPPLETSFLRDESNNSIFFFSFSPPPLPLLPIVDSAFAKPSLFLTLLTSSPTPHSDIQPFSAFQLAAAISKTRSTTPVCTCLEFAPSLAFQIHVPYLPRGCDTIFVTASLPLPSTVMSAV